MSRFAAGSSAVLLVGGFIGGFVRAGSPAPSDDRPTPQELEFFEAKVRPLLAERCFKCHGAAKSKSGLRLDSRATLLAGGERGAAAVPGNPDESLLVQAVRRAGELKMPPTGALDDAEVATLVEWVKLGLPWPEASKDAADGGAASSFTDEQRAFWSFQPVKDPSPPAVLDASWPRGDLDRFVLAALEARGLAPAPPADRRTLIRRATFDLTGLPPTPEEVAAFLADESPDAFARVVDRLLASPRYGERWARHWLDVVRYTDWFDARSLNPGAERADVAEAWRYRDWVVDAFNRDLPYAQFVVDQIAGDLLAEEGPQGFDPSRVIATGMLAIGNWGGGDSDKEKVLTDVVDDQVDVVGRAFLGLTVGCARCHDHKFDPIPTEDYYGLAGIFMSSHVLAEPGAKTEGSPVLRIALLSRAEQESRRRRELRIAELGKSIEASTVAAQRELARSLLPDTARYLAAVWDWTHGSSAPGAGAPAPGAAAPSLADFAERRGLHVFALRRWLDLLEPAGGRMLATPVRDLLGKHGLFAWKNEEETPSAVVNASDAAAAFLTVTLPPKCVAVHPSPRAGVAVVWESPITGSASLHVRIADADAVCGDGVDYAVERVHGPQADVLVAGTIASGGATDSQLERVAIQRGEQLRVVVRPKGGYECDTTVVELSIAEGEGEGDGIGARRSWSLTDEVLAAAARGELANPQPDRHGQPDVWSFRDLAPRAAVDPAIEGDAALPHWIEIVRSATAADRGELERLAPDFAAAVAPLIVELDDLKAHPPQPLEQAVGIQEGGVPNSAQAGIHDVQVHVRGRYDRLGDVVPRHFPRILAGEEQPPIPEGASGRLELARWITRPDHPLSARVIVNRVWQHHFDAGIVRTPGNFGNQGEPPTHPELLDWLARRFVESGGSVKALHRSILLSNAWQQSSAPAAAALEADPENRLLARATRRRLEAEELRDAMLAVAGELDDARGGPAVRDPATRRRTLYVMTVRSDRSSWRELFDAADPTASVDQRTTATVAPQALYLMNDAFVLARAEALARRILADDANGVSGANEAGGASGDRGRIARTYELLFARPPTDDEVEIGLAALARGETTADDADARLRSWSEYVQVLLWSNEWTFVD